MQNYCGNSRTNLTGLVMVFMVAVLSLVVFAGLPSLLKSFTLSGELTEVISEPVFYPTPVANLSLLQVSVHAVAGHPEAKLIEKCLNDMGGQGVMNFKSKLDKDTWYTVCKLPDGRWGLAAFDKSLKFNKTAFVKGNGSWKELMDYLLKIATKINKTIPIS